MEDRDIITVPYVGDFKREDIVHCLKDIKTQMDNWDTMEKYSDESASVLREMGNNQETCRLRGDLREMYEMHTASIRRNIHTLLHQLFEKRIETAKR